MHSIQHLLGTVLLLFGVFVICYYLVVNGGYLLLHVLALFELRDDVRDSRWNPPFRRFSSPFYPGIGIVVPAYNEEATIVESVQSMLSLNYPELEVVVVNDGSTDATLDRLVETFDLEAVDADIPFDVPSEEIHRVYRSRTDEELLVVDKENGGKSDALNAGVWLADMPLFCAVDSDTVIDRDALLQIVTPFLEHPAKAVASGGVIRVANECVVRDGIVEEVNLPKTGLPGLQVMEYLRAFYSGRLGLARLKGLILISGAFGVFRTDRVREIGGYRHDTITEDFDVVVRLHEYLSDEDVDYTVDFIPEPVAWTEVPDTLRTLGRQRRRWYRGMMETVVASRRMFFRRAYGRVGTVILPFFTAAEALGPLIEGFGYVLLPIAWYLGILNIEFFLTFLLLTVGAGIFLSWFGVLSEVWSYNRYESPWDVLRLLWYGVLENFGYRQWKTIVAWHGLIEYLRGDQSWGVMERRGFGTDDEAAPPSAAPGATVTAGATAATAGTETARSAATATDETAATDRTAANSGFVWIDWLTEASDTDGLRWLDRIATEEAPGRFAPVTDPTVGAGDGGFVWTRDFADSVGDGGFVWTTDPSDGAGDGGFVLAPDADGALRLIETTAFTDGVGDGGFVWTTDPTVGAGDGGFVWTREFADGAGDEGLVWVVDAFGDGDD